VLLAAGRVQTDKMDTLFDRYSLNKPKHRNDVDVYYFGGKTQQMY